MQGDDVYLNYIGGQWKQGSSGQWAPNVNPARPTDILGKLTLSNAIDVNRAIEAAVGAQKAWAEVPRPKRADVIAKTATIIRHQAEKIAKTLTREEGKNLVEARGEVAKTLNVLEFTAAEGRRPTGQVIPSDVAGTMIYTTRAPRGVVAAITPWNFPICIPAWKIAPALLEGNAVVFKPASVTPATAVLLVRAFEEAGLPPGVLNLVFGNGATVGNALASDPRVSAVSFTGSEEVGRQVYSLAAAHLAAVQLEMGGKNPVIVCADADIDLAVAATVKGAFGSTGQRCTATSRVLVDRSVHAAFREKLLEKVRAIKVGDGIESPDAMGPSVDKKQFETVLAAIERAKKEGLKLLCGGERVGAESPETGYFTAPTIFDEVPATSFLAQEEVFGPVLAIIPVGGPNAGLDEAITVANNVRYGLSSSVFTRDVGRALKYADRVETGMLHVNCATIGGEAQAPFGGMKATGLGGREMGATGPEFFCEIKTVYIDTAGSLPAMY